MADSIDAIAKKFREAVDQETDQKLRLECMKLAHTAMSTWANPTARQLTLRADAYFQFVKSGTISSADLEFD